MIAVVFTRDCCSMCRLYLVQTTHVNSFPFKYGGQGSAPHIPSTGYRYAPPLSLLPFVAVSGALSIQMADFLLLCPYHSADKYPQYSAFHPRPSQVYRPGIIIYNEQIDIWLWETSVHNFERYRTFVGSFESMLCRGSHIRVKEMGRYPEE